MASYINILPMKTMSPCLFFLPAWLLLSYLSIVADGISKNSTVRCIDKEREALLKFKEGIVDNCNTLTYWGDDSYPDCCTWYGVSCSGHSGHVIGLELQGFGIFGHCLQGKIGPSLLELKHLNYLDLFNNNLQGITVAKRGAGFCSLELLNLSYNNLTNEISSIIQLLSNCANTKLEYLYLENNQLRGPIPQSINKFFLLKKLDLSNNRLQGTLSESHLSNLSRLNTLRLGDNPKVVVNISAKWIPSFQLEVISLNSCKLGPCFPKWLLPTQTNFTELHLANTGISDSIPDSFWHSLPTHLDSLDLSQNNIYGTLPNSSTDFYNSPWIDLSSNCLEGALPSFPRNLSFLALSNNKFSNSIPLLCPSTKMMLMHLDLSNNSLSGKLPDCWLNFDQLKTLDLGNNNFTEILPTSIGSLKNLEELRLRNNKFHGELPMSPKNYTSLYVLDVSHNSMTGHIPSKIGSSLNNLIVLNLRNNNFRGKLPLSLCQLSQLQILDLSVNHISGTIPTCIYDLHAMKEKRDFYIASGSQENPATIMWKRIERSFKDYGGLLSISISDNELEGQIPSGISSLRGLASLDLARNILTGNIPSNIGQLTALQYLDLSSNHLSGGIPASLANVASLEMLDLSTNNLSGRIPQGTQLQSFDPSNYSGNPLLCGPPLPNCPGDQAPINRQKGDSIPQHEEKLSDILFPGLYISVLLGFITGFWAVCGSLALKTSWRHACFRFVEDMMDRLYVMFAVNVASVWRRKQQVDR